MDDFPVGNPKYSRIKATYAQPPVRHQPTQEPPDRWQDDITAVVIGIGVLILIYLLASAGAVPAR